MPVILAVSGQVENVTLNTNFQVRGTTPGPMSVERRVSQ